MKNLVSDNVRCSFFIVITYYGNLFIKLVKKQISEAMDHYRDIAHACHEKIEKEEIRQNEVNIYQILV